MFWPFKKETRSTQKNQRISIYWKPTSFFLSIGEKTPENKVVVSGFETLPPSKENLKTCIKKYDLAHQASALVISPSQFELFLLDSLPVNEDEIHAALRWRIKELISYPIQDACWDFFQVPTQDARKYLLYVVVSHAPTLTKIVSDIESAELTIKEITIPAIALQNLLNLHPDNQKGIGLLFEEENNLKIMIVKSNQLYLIRQFDTPLSVLIENNTISTQHVEELTLFLQRSFDYYQSQLHQTPVVNLLLLPEFSLCLDYLSKNLPCKIEILNLENYFETSSSFDNDGMISLAALLRD